MYLHCPEQAGPGWALRRFREAGSERAKRWHSQFLAQAVHFGFKLGDIPVPVRYFDEASSINLWRSICYGTGTLGVLAKFWLHRIGIRSKLFRA